MAVQPTTSIVDTAMWVNVNHCRKLTALIDIRLPTDFAYPAIESQSVRVIVSVLDLFQPTNHDMNDQLRVLGNLYC